MKQSIYLRIAKSGKVEASQKPRQDPLRGRARQFEPTVFLTLQLTIPDEAFKPPTISASISVPIEKMGTAVEVVDPMKVL